MSQQNSLIRQEFRLDRDRVFDVWVYKRPSNGEYWFKGKEVATLLGYKYPSEAVSYHVATVHRRSWDELVEDIDVVMTPIFWQSGTIFLSGMGLQQLVHGCTKPEAEIFKTWLMERNLVVIQQVCDDVRELKNQLALQEKKTEDALKAVDFKEREMNEVVLAKDREIQLKDRMLLEMHQATLAKDEEMRSKDRRLQQYHRDMRLKDQEIRSKDRRLTQHHRDMRFKDRLLQRQCRDMALKDEMIVFKDEMLNNAISTFNEKGKDMICKPERRDLLHTILVYRDLDEPDTYLFIRTQKGSVLQAKDRVRHRADVDRPPFFKRDYIPNGIHVLHKVKESLRKNRKPYRACNNTLTLLQDGGEQQTPEYLLRLLRTACKPHRFGSNRRI